MLLLKIGVVVKVLRSLAAVICNFLYRIIATMYQLFMTISRLDILSSDQIAPIYQRITMILTIVMTFYITFEFVKYTIQPDMMTDKDKGMGNILQRIVLVVIMIAFVPTIFRFACSLQNRIVESQLISKVLLGRTNTNYVSYGNEFSAIMLNLFYDLDPDNCRNMSKDCTKASTTVTNNLNNLRTKGTVDIASDINLAADEEFNLIPLLAEIDPAIKFDGIFAIIVGVFIAYVLAMYCIDLGSRYVQLMFLQIISPIAIMGYLLPKKDGIFQKWVKQCTTTYLDLFLRIAIIDFVLLIIKILGEAFDNQNIFSGISGVTPTLKALTYVALVLGLLTFAQRAPKLLSELFPSSGAAGIGFGLKAANRVAPGAARAIGGAAGGLNAMARKGIGSAVNRFRQNRENEGRSSAQQRSEHRRTLDDANTTLRAARNNLRTARRNGGDVTAAQEAYRQARNEQIDAQSTVDKDKNERYRSVVGAAISGALTGAATGASTGFGATKLQDIPKKINEGTKKVNESVTATQRYYDAGGTGGIDRIITKTEQAVGIQTPSQRTAEEIKRLDEQIKGADGIINMQRMTKKSVDSAEERGQSKAKTGELQINAEGIKIKTGLSDPSKAVYVGLANETLSDIYLKFHKDAEIKKAQLEAAINNKMDQATIDKLKIESSEADTAEAIVLKNVSRAAFTKYLNPTRFKDTDKRDGAMENFIANAINDLNRTLNHSETQGELIEEIQRRIKSGELRQEVLTAVQTRNYQELTFDEFDTVKQILVDISNEKERQLSLIKDAKAKLETSTMYDAQKANADGGKK